MQQTNISNRPNSSTSYYEGHVHLFVIMYKSLDKLNLTTTTTLNQSSSFLVSDTQNETSVLDSSSADQATATDTDNACFYYDDDFLPIQQIFRLYIDAPMLVIGVIGNLINILVFTDISMRHQIVNRSLLLLSISDCLIILSGSFMMTIPVLVERTGVGALLQYTARTTRWLFPIGQMAATSSVYLTVFVSTYQCILVTHRRYAYKHLTHRFCNCCLTGIIVFSILFNLNRCIELKLELCLSRRYNLTIEQLVPTMVMQLPNYYLVYHVYLTAFIQVFLPMVTLVFVNCYFIRFLHGPQRLIRRPLMRTNNLVIQIATNSSNVRNHLRNSFHLKRTYGTNNVKTKTKTIKTINKLNSKKLRKTSAPSMKRSVTLENNNAPQVMLNGHHIAKSSNELVNLSTKPRPSYMADVEEVNGFLTPTDASSRKPSQDSTNNENGAAITATTVLLPVNFMMRRVQSNVNRTRSMNKYINYRRHHMRRERELSITLMLLGVVGVFLACSVVVFINNLIELFAHYHTSVARLMQSSVFTVLVEVGNFMVVFNAATSTFIYFGLNSTFRRVLWSRLCCSTVTDT